jgi:hypothetical protein
MGSGVTAPPPPVLEGPMLPAAGISSIVAAAPRPYQLAPPTEESSTIPESASRLMLWLIVALVLVAGALAGVYFGVIRKSAPAPAPAPAPTAPNH